jgi:hypothetical protein
MYIIQSAHRNACFIQNSLLIHMYIIQRPKGVEVAARPVTGLSFQVGCDMLG